jgi:thiamine monophosphate synthase
VSEARRGAAGRGFFDGVAVVLVADAPTAGAHHLVERVAEILGAVPRGALLVLERDLPEPRGGSSDIERLTRVRRLRELASRHGAPLVVSGRVDLALAGGADGVQLPELGLDAATVRRRFPQLRVGRSVHDAAGLSAAELEGAHWAILAPVWRPLSKEATSPALGLEAFRELTAGHVCPDRRLGRRHGRPVRAASRGGRLCGREPRGDPPRRVAPSGGGQAGRGLPRWPVRLTVSVKHRTKPRVIVA